jgi:pyruvate formate-lyase/glycerol dehydratase family glycyl radical enzyme
MIIKEGGINMSTMKADRLKTNGPLAVEPYDKEWGVGVSGLDEDVSPFPRINRMLEKTKSARRTGDKERMLIVSESYAKYKAESQVLKVAKTFRNILSKVTVRIDEDELIVGEIAAPAWAAPLYPDFSFQWLVKELKEGDLHTERHNDKYYFDDETKQAVFDVAKFWEGRSVEDGIHEALTEEEYKGGSWKGKGVYFNDLYTNGGVGHVCANYQKLLEQGYGGIKKHVEAKLVGIKIGDPDATKRREFYEAALISLEGATLYFKRYAALAKEMADKEQDAKRKAELERISGNCNWVSENPPRDFWEAIQLWYLATNLILIEANGHSVTYGRFDQLMYPFYKNDIEQGTLTREFMQELIECSFIKMDHLSKIRDKIGTEIASGIGWGGTALDVGGVDSHGKDAVNDISYMVLDAHAHTRITNPWMAARIATNNPREYKVKVFNVIRIGTGEPKIFNDEQMIQSLLNYGKPIKEARDYVGIGCVEPNVPGKTYGWHDATYFNMTKVLSLAINDGQCVDCSDKCPRYAHCAGAGKRLGLKTGKLQDMKSFAEVQEAFDRQMEYWIDRMISSINTMDTVHQRLKPLPYLSLLVDDCIEKGVDISAGGARYNHAGPQGVGLGTVTDSLTTIKQLIFDEKKYSTKELMDALHKNWDGYDTMLSYVNSDRVHHYGNDDDYADDIAKFVIDIYCKHVEHRPTAHGGEFLPGIYSVSINVPCGMFVAATPDGRKSGEPVSDCLGPVHTKQASHDVKGPMALANSLSKLDQARIGNGVILNWKFSPGTLSGKTGRDNLITLMDVYFDKGGMQSQFNVLGKETLLAAQKNPDEYRNLMVRVAGYSAFFTQLSPELQNDLIGRTELSFD